MTPQDPGKNRESSRKRAAETGKAYRQANHEQIRASKKAFSLAHRAEIAAYKKLYRLTHKDKIQAYALQWNASNLERLAALARIRYHKKKSISIVRHNPEDVYRMVSKAVSGALPRFMRDDVISTMLLAVLEGELLMGNVGARVKEYVGRYNRQYDSFKTLSLDAPMGGTDLRRIDLLEAPAAYDSEADEEEDSEPEPRHFIIGTR